MLVRLREDVTVILVCGLVQGLASRVDSFIKFTPV